MSGRRIVVTYLTTESPRQAPNHYRRVTLHGDHDIRVFGDELETFFEAEQYDGDDLA